MTAPTVASRDHARFVTAARWLRNNGWRPDVTTFGTCREMRWRKDADTISVVFAQGVTLRLQGIRGTWLQLDDPADVQRVLDQLVLAHTLPAGFASWTPQPKAEDESPCPRCWHRIDWHLSSGCTAVQCNCTLSTGNARAMSRRIGVAR